MIITIDGSIATGKSTVAKKLAEQMGYIYYDTGAMYRCLTYGLLQKQINLDDHNKIIEFLNTFHFDIKIHHQAKRYYVDKEDVTEKIRNEVVTSNVSKVAAIGAVRDKLVSMQRELSIGVNAVFEGRDMGTVVFPNALLKVYLTGRPEARAKRRFEEQKLKFPEDTVNLTIEKVIEDLYLRDTLDSTREISPLKQPEDACVVDTSDLTPDEVVLQILIQLDRRKKQIKLQASAEQ